MWELGNFWTEHESAPVVPVRAMVHEIHVMVVDHDTETLARTISQLQVCQYRVTYTGVAQDAIPMLLSHEKVKYDVLMVDLQTPHDPNGFKLLLQHALCLGIPVVWMSEDDNTMTAMRALENGAFISIKKPPPMEFLKCLWQQVLREKTIMQRERDMFVATSSSNNLGVEFREVIHQRIENPTPNSKGKLKVKSRSRHDYYNDQGYDETDNVMSLNGNVRRKMCTEWTPELHAKFIAAVQELGPGGCFPKQILEKMNVPGLTRMQVASHLQKCRNDNWRSPEERKPIISHQAPNGSRTQSKPRRFGVMPLINKTQEMGQGGWEIRPPNYGYVNFSDIDGLINDFPARPEINNPNPTLTQQGYQLDPSFNDDKEISGDTVVKGSQ